MEKSISNEYVEKLEKEILKLKQINRKLIRIATKSSEISKDALIELEKINKK